jgi:hypothetical protein
MCGKTGIPWVGSNLAYDPSAFIARRQWDAQMDMVRQAQASAATPEPKPAPKAIERKRAGTIIDMQQRPGDDDWSPVVEGK